MSALFMEHEKGPPVPADLHMSDWQAPFYLFEVTSVSYFSTAVMKS